MEGHIRQVGLYFHMNTNNIKSGFQNLSIMEKKEIEIKHNHLHDELNKLKFYFKTNSNKL